MALMGSLFGFAGMFFCQRKLDCWDGFDNKVVATLLCHIYDVSKI